MDLSAFKELLLRRGVTSRRSFRMTKDIKPRNPESYFQDWPGWNEFFWDESKAAQTYEETMVKLRCHDVENYPGRCPPPLGNHGRMDSRSQAGEDRVMQQRPLGRTGLSVSVIGYGGFKIGRNRQHRFAADYDLPTEAEAARLLNGVLDAGITLIDTAPAYGLSEERIGQAIGHRRDGFVLATKVGEDFNETGSTFDFSASAITSSVERSLARLQTDRLDIVCVHSDGKDLSVQNETDVVSTLQELKQRGLVRTIGFSGKTVDGSRVALDWADVLMVTCNERDVTHLPVIQSAKQRGIGVIVKKGLDSGRLPVTTAVPFVVGQTGVSSLLIGTLSVDHLRECIRIAEPCDA